MLQSCMAEIKVSSPSHRVSASFRDPSGFLFYRDSVLYRQVNSFYRNDYERLIRSGLYNDLVSSGLLIPHEEVNVEPAEPLQAYKVIRPEPVAFVSYPYEWSFSQLKDAALTTLAIQKRSLEFGMSLKDASAYNIQFHRGRPVLIDTLSFETYREGEPWIAYRQFCQHFLAPLALMAYRDIRLSQLLRVYIDGLPLDLTSRLLPIWTWLSLPLFVHIHLHTVAQRRYANIPMNQMRPATRHISRAAFLGLIDSLESAIHRLRWKPVGTEWVEYYMTTNYLPEAMQHKQELVCGFLDRIQPHSVWDLGANTGLFSRLASKRGIFTLAFDIDPGAVERNYLRCVAEGETNLLPLVLDLTNPSPSIGWCTQERMSWLDRAPADAILALAVIHHLAIANNIPLERLAEFFSQLGHWLIIEFVPKSDSQVQRMLATRDDIFPEYTQAGFEHVFRKFFISHAAERIRDSERILYLMEARRRL